MRHLVFGWKRLTLTFIIFSAWSVMAAKNGRERVTMNIGLGRTEFTGVNQTDAKAALKVFTQSMGKRKGYDMDVTIQTFASGQELAAAVSEKCPAPHKYLLLVGKDSPYKTLAGLRGKPIHLLETATCGLSKYWIEILIMEEEHESLDRSFSNSRIEHNVSKAILPVFFGKAEACVIHRPALDIMTELNPQVGRRLRAIAVSEPLVDALICMPKEDGLSPSYRRDITDALLALQKDVYGRQILTLYKTEGMVRFKEKFLIETRALMQRHSQLIQKETTP